jgi:hypothetical protein
VLAFESGGLREPLQRQAGASGFKVDVWIPEIYESVRQVRQICRARWTEMHTSKDGSETNEIGHGKLRVVCNLIVGYQFVCGSKAAAQSCGLRCSSPICLGVGVLDWSFCKNPLLGKKRWYGRRNWVRLDKTTESAMYGW